MAERLRQSDPETSGRSRAGAMWLVCAVWGAYLCAVVTGCRMKANPPAPQKPAKHLVRGDQLLVYSNFRIPDDHDLIRDLKELRHRVYEELRLPVQRRPVSVYLFEDEAAYRKYLARMYPTLPHRRAYFFKTADELAVYTYWGERIQEDLRHEFTHGLLHASLKTVPLWLDEGLAEYFEVIAPEPGALNGDYADELAQQMGRGWTPDIERLEGLEEFAAMQRLDYQEAWAWVHYMLHASPETREALLGYLQDLRTQTKPYALSQRLKAMNPHFESRFVAYIGSLNSLHRAAPGAVPREPSPFPNSDDDVGRAVVSGATASVGMPTYQFRLPEHVRGRMMLVGEGGHVSFGDGPTIFAQAHRHGWDDFERAFLSGEVDLDRIEQVRAFAEDPGTEYWDLAREARKQGVLDCYRALREHSAREGARAIQLNYREAVGKTGVDAAFETEENASERRDDFSPFLER